ncbi:MAG TPA: hypothetical protein DDX04_07985 [Massilia sp.]|nr:hypothetical protein [Massilia sp.]
MTEEAAPTQNLDHWHMESLLSYRGEQAMGKKAIKAAGRAQVFKQASEAEVLHVVVFVQLFVAGAAVLFPELLTFEGAWLAVPGFCAGTVVLYLLCYFQQVVIEGSFVQVRSTATFFRWRRFDVGDVQGVRRLSVASDADVQAFIVSFKPAHERSWKRVRLVASTSAGENKGIDAPVIVAFMRAVTCVQPDIKVENLPPGYRGALAPPPLPIAAPLAPPSRGKTRKRKQAAAADRANRDRRPKVKL